MKHSTDYIATCAACWMNMHCLKRSGMPRSAGLELGMLRKMYVDFIQLCGEHQLLIDYVVESPVYVAIIPRSAVRKDGPI